jgi:integrase
MRNDILEHRFKLALGKVGLANQGIVIHSLRSAGATAYANAGANIEEIKRVLGDASPTAALRYVQTTGRHVELSAKLEGI